MIWNTKIGMGNTAISSGMFQHNETMLIMSDAYAYAYYDICIYIYTYIYNI